MSVDERRKQVVSERRDRRRKREETRLLKRERRVARLQQKGWNEASLHEHERQRKALAERQRKQQCIEAPGEATTYEQKCAQMTEPPPENLLRIAVVGCGGWFCNRALLPALAKVIRKLPVCITVLCGSNYERALKTLRRNGISLSVQQQEAGDGSVAVFDTLEAYLNYERDLSEETETGGYIPRNRALADVCLLLLPIPQMAEAIGMCLRCGKVSLCVILGRMYYCTNSD